jgi:hypothetical protein
MAGTYQHASDWIPGYPPFSGVIRVSDGKFIACAANSAEWQEYLDWAAADPANIPDPFLSPNAGGVAIVPAEDQLVYGSMLESIPPVDPALAPPVMRDVPHVSVKDDGTVEVGATLTCTMGNWDGEPTSYEYRWFNNAPADLSAGSTYVVAASDGGHNVFCVVTATNPNGSTAAPPSNSVEVPVPEPVEPPGTEPAVTPAASTARAVPRAARSEPMAPAPIAPPPPSQEPAKPKTTGA